MSFGHYAAHGPTFRAPSCPPLSYVGNSYSMNPSVAPPILRPASRMNESHFAGLYHHHLQALPGVALWTGAIAPMGPTLIRPLSAASFQQGPGRGHTHHKPPQQAIGRHRSISFSGGQDHPGCLRALPAAPAQVRAVHAPAPIRASQPFRPHSAAGFTRPDSSAVDQLLQGLVTRRPSTSNAHVCPSSALQAVRKPTGQPTAAPANRIAPRASSAAPVLRASNARPAAQPANQQADYSEPKDPWMPVPKWTYPLRSHRFKKTLAPKAAGYFPGPGVRRLYWRLNQGYDLPIPDPSWGILPLWSEFPSIAQKEAFVSIYVVDNRVFSQFADDVIAAGLVACVSRYKNQQEVGFLVVVSHEANHLVQWIASVQWQVISIHKALAEPNRRGARTNMPPPPVKLDNPFVKVLAFKDQSYIPQARTNAWDYGFRNELVPTGKDEDNYLLVSTTHEALSFVKDQPMAPDALKQPPAQHPPPQLAPQEHGRALLRERQREDCVVQ